METGKKRFIAAVLLALALVPVLAAAGGCGGNDEATMKDTLVDYTIRNIIIPLKQLPAQLVVLRQYPVEDLSAGPEVINEKMWKVEDGTVTEISLEEFTTLTRESSGGDDLRWTASQHSIQVLGLDEEAGSALVEVDSMYGPLAAEGVVYRLEYSDGAWKVVDKATAWVS